MSDPHTPSPPPEQRRLAAIMVADIAGFSALMEKDESRTFERVRSLRERLIVPRVNEYGGRIIKTTGDGFLAEFPSATSAMRCGVEIQRENHAHEASRPEAERIRMRIGLNVGDVLIDGDDIAGDGVIIAARLEPLAPPDGLCVSGTVREHVRQDLGIEFLDLGDQHVKNISRPIRAYRIDLVGPSGVPFAQPASRREQSPPSSSPDRSLSVVVLPFVNRTGDPAQEYFSDAITECVTVDLSRIRDLLTIGASTAYSFKNKPASAQHVGRELGVRFVLQGSVQRSGTRIRINSQLSDSTTNAQLWSEVFEGDQSDLFALQDQVTARLASSIGREMVIIAGREAETRTSNPKAVDFLLRARALTVKPVQGLKDLQEAEGLCRQALALEPNFVSALAMLANSLALQARNSFDDSDPGSLERMYAEARDLAERARALDPGHPATYMALALVAIAHDDYPAYRRAVETCVSLQPKNPRVNASLAWALMQGGEVERAIEVLTEAMALDPKRPSVFVLANLGWAYFMRGDNDAAIEWALKWSDLNPASPQPYALMAVAYLLQGDDARAQAASTRVRAPEARLKSLAPGKSHPSAYKRYFEEKLAPAWRKAGLPE